MTASHDTRCSIPTRPLMKEWVNGTLEEKHLDDRERMEAGCLIDGTARLNHILQSQVIGQDPSIGALICSFSRVLSGLRDSSRPVLTMLLLGPTGVGKTETAKALAQTLFGSERALTRINCAEYAHGHEMSKLLGSPPGYVGYNIEPLLSQKRIDDPHRQAVQDRTGMLGEGDVKLNATFSAEDGKCLSVILFDEIEKAHPMVWNALLGILEDGMLTLGDNTTTDFTRSIILLTSNVGSGELSKLLEHNPIGFQGEAEPQPEAQDLTQTALAQARAVFPFEFLNRFDEILVYGPLGAEHLDGIFEKFLSDIHERALKEAGIPLLIKPSPDAKRLIIERGTDVRFGARPLRRAMEKLLVDPLSRLIASKAVGPGDVVEVEREGEGLAFFRTSRRNSTIVARAI